MSSNFSCMPIAAGEKIIEGKIPRLYENRGICFKNERFSFQIAFKGEKKSFPCASIEYDESLVEVRRILSVPCTTVNPEAEWSDDYSCVSSPTVIGDVLQPIGKSGVHISDRIWNSVFVTVKDGVAAGDYALSFVFKDSEGAEIGRCGYNLRVANEELPPNDLFVTHWLHADCLAETHGVEIFGERFFEILRNYLKNAVAHGITVLFVPAFTPPLDTKIGEERPTAQLVKAYYFDGAYTFDFSLVKRYIDLAKECGIKYFEFAHVVSQWGARSAPKIIISAKEGEKRFGWHTDSTGEEYLEFLSKYFSALREFCKNEGIVENSYFHVSDEPNEKDVDRYVKIRSLLLERFPEAKVIDAISEYVFFERSGMEFPAVALENAEQFAGKCENYIVYYCMAQRAEFVANSFLFTPPERVRILGYQMYLNGAKGFLHWGYNYYKSALSLENVNPYCVTDCGGRFQSGDAYLVYPAEGGVYSSVREEYLASAIDDYRACKLLEKKRGREFVAELLKRNGIEGYKTYVHSALWLSGVRNEILSYILEK